MWGGASVQSSTHIGKLRPAATCWRLFQGRQSQSRGARWCLSLEWNQPLWIPSLGRKRRETMSVASSASNDRGPVHTFTPQQHLLFCAHCICVLFFFAASLGGFWSLDAELLQLRQSAVCLGAGVYLCARCVFFVSLFVAFGVRWLSAIGRRCYHCFQMGVRVISVLRYSCRVFLHSCHLVLGTAFCRCFSAFVFLLCSSIAGEVFQSLYLPMSKCIDSGLFCRFAAAASNAAAAALHDIAPAFMWTIVLCYFCCCICCCRLRCGCRDVPNGSPSAQATSEHLFDSLPRLLLYW